MKTLHSRHFLFPLALLAVFAGLTVMVTLGRQRAVRIKALTSRQNVYADIAANFIVQRGLYPDSLASLSEIAPLFPPQVNLGVWTPNGELIYDNEIDVAQSTLGCYNLPEIDEAIVKGSGRSIRKSNFLNQDYAYYAKLQDGYIIRIAFPYDKKIRSELRPDIFYSGMMLLIFTLFAIVYSIYHFRFLSATKKLKIFLSTYMQKKEFPEHISFSDTELSEIQTMFTDICNQLEANERSMSEMTNNIAHELRTPVTSIRGYLETLLDYRNISNDKKYEFIERAYNQSLRLSEIIQDVILLSKTADAPHYFSLEKVNICELLDELLDDTAEIVAERNVHIDIDVPADTTVEGSRTLLYSVFRNLLGNALKYAGEGITVTIRCYKQDEQFYYFLFSDNGQGVDDRYLAHLFDRFYRINEGRSRDKGGSGLGLAIVRDAIKFHHGAISAANRPEGGLAFLFTIRKK